MNNIELLDSIYTSIATVSSNEYSEKIKNIIKAEHNTYGIRQEIFRAETVLDLLKMGVDQGSVLRDTENQKEDFALSCIRSFQNVFNIKY